MTLYTEYSRRSTSVRNYSVPPSGVGGWGLVDGWMGGWVDGWMGGYQSLVEIGKRSSAQSTEYSILRTK